ncbi:hypothetical protein A2U01_0099684, partial [Trifolium medium]|nr:hypothetical protein [Trifolium medium]
RRFGFVKFRDVKDARELLDLISNIWLGSFKLRVNLSHFEKGAPRKTVAEVALDGRSVAPESSKRGKAAVDEGRTFA